MARKLSLILVLVLFCSGAWALDLVKDINTTTEPQASYPHDGGTVPRPVVIAGGSLLVMDDGSHGNELWITDGTPAGTHLVRDINAGAGSSGIERFFVMGGVAYFSADDGVNGYELWRSDGTGAGTRIVANIGAGALGAGGDFRPPAAIAVAGNSLYFAAADDKGLELWRSDGTAAGTYRVKDINPGSAGSDIQQIVVSGTRIYFGASDEESGFEPWTSDGTTPGTVRIADVNPGNAGSGAWFDAVVGGTAFFHADDGVHGTELWRVAANGNGASMVADLNTTPSGAGSNTLGSQPKVFAVGSSVVLIASSGTPFNETRSLYAAGATGGATLLTVLPADAEIQTFISIGARATFRIDTQASNHPWWVTDGTPAGTARVPSLDRPPAGDTDVSFGGGAAFFTVWSNDSFSSEIWRTDGTLAGTSKYADILGQRYNSDIEYFDGRVFFVNEASPGSADRELWVSDGTPAGTVLFGDLLPGGEGSNPILFGTAGAKLLFFARDLVVGFEPWVTDGTTVGTLRLGNFAPESTTLASNPVLLGDTSNGVLLKADDGVHGYELWVSDGTGVGTHLLTDIYPGQFDSRMSNASRLGDLLLFAAQDPVAGHELWRSDGTPGGTFRVSDIWPGATGGIPGYDYLPTAVMGGNLYFIAQDPTHYRALWRTDGTVAGTAPAADIPQILSFDNIEIMGASSTRVLVRQQTGQDPGTVWSTNGDPASAVQVASDVFVDNTWSVRFGERLCFPARQTAGAEIWCSSGVPGDMERITNLASMNLQVIGVPQVVNNTLLVMAAGAGASVLVATDGTPATTKVISNLLMANIPGLPFGGGLVYLTVDAGVRTLMYTDGTAAGTRPFIAGASPLPGGIQAVAPALFAGSVVFVVHDPARGPVIWRSDGTAGGTRYLADVDPGTDASSGPDGFTVHAGKLLFSAPRLGIGQELWSLSSATPNASDDVGSGATGGSIVASVLANDGDFDGSLNPGTVEIVSAPASGATTIDTGTGAITYTPNAGFSGSDQLTYRVADNDGNLSNVAYLSLVVAGAVGNDPGVAPATPPTPAPTPAPSPAPTPSGGGGGGGLGMEMLLMLTLAMAASRLSPTFRRRKG